MIVFDVKVIFSKNIADQPEERTPGIHCYVFKTVKR